MIDITAIIELFERLGIPVGFLILMYILYVKTQTWNQKYTEQTAILSQQQMQSYEKLSRESQDRYEELTNRFIDTTNKIIAKNAEAIQLNAIAMHALTARIDVHDARSIEIIPKLTAKDDLIVKMQRTVDDMYQLLKETMRDNRKNK